MTTQRNNRRKVASAKRPQAPAKKKGATVKTWVAGAFALIAVVAVVAIVANSGSNGAAATGAPAASTASGNTPAAAPADEQKYIGRLLPASYTEPAVGAASTYSSTIQMSNVTPTQNATQISIALSDVTSKKIVYFEYQKAGAAPIPLMAYVKPSGKLFVAISLCPPCKSTQQTIEADGTLTCASCGTKRDLETGVGISGACRLYPADEVPATVVGGRIVILNSVLNAWSPQPLDRPVGA
jgi:nitrite reductase/ring-hydroxylating ferredoxin subunit